MRMRRRKRSSWDSGSGYVPSCSRGFWVASTMKGRGSGYVEWSSETCASFMASRRLDCVLGVVRLISSASTMLVKSGPGLKTKSLLAGSQMLTPMTSDGSMSEVNWMRGKPARMERAGAAASVVLPTPGTSSIRRCPRARRPTTASRTTSGLPTRARLTLASSRWIKSSAWDMDFQYTPQPRPATTVSRGAPIRLLEQEVRPPPAEPARGLLPLQRDVLVGRRVGVAGDEAEARLLDARPHAVQEGQLPDGRVDNLIQDELLHLVQDGLAALPIQLGRLLLEEAVDVGVAAIDVVPAGDREGLETRGGVAEGPARPLDEVLELLLPVPAEERRPLERAELHANPRRLEIVGDGLAQVGVGGVAEVIAGIEAVGVAGLGEELLGPGGAVCGRRGLPEELERA